MQVTNLVGVHLDDDTPIVLSVWRSRGWTHVSFVDHGLYLVVGDVAVLRGLLAQLHAVAELADAPAAEPLDTEAAE